MNVGLIRQVLQAFRRFSVLKLGKTYLSLTIIDIAKHTSPDPSNYAEAVHYLRWLIATGQLNAALAERGSGPQDWVLKFGEEFPSKSEASQLRELKATETRMHELSARIHESDQKAGLTKEYLDWCRKAEAKGKDETPSFQDLMEDYVHDEDVMVDT